MSCLTVKLSHFSFWHSFLGSFVAVLPYCSVDRVISSVESASFSAEMSSLLEKFLSFRMIETAFLLLTFESLSGRKCCDLSQSHLASLSKGAQHGGTSGPICEPIAINMLYYSSIF
jgi:TRAP-type mannitol/chloroaromatic compound transport system permease small subunit